jgi:hypothetical protein
MGIFDSISVLYTYFFPLVVHPHHKLLQLLETPYQLTNVYPQQLNLDEPFVSSENSKLSNMNNPK